MSKIYFSDIFRVPANVVENYGAFNVSLVTDLPLFIDPFLLFNSKKPKYQQLHEQMISYLRFLRDKSIDGGVTKDLLTAWYMFHEVKQNWLGFCEDGNSGRGLEMDFAVALDHNLHVIFNNFGQEEIAHGSHMEKLCLIKSGVGRDNISDFATNLIKDYLLEYTQDFAKANISPKHRRKLSVPKVRFNYTTETWETDEFELPFTNGDYVILTPRDILTRDDVWINRNDLINSIVTVAEAVDDAVLRAQINNYLLRVLPEKPSKKQQVQAIEKALGKYPMLLEYYIRLKEQEGTEAEHVSERNVHESHQVFITQTVRLIEQLQRRTPFYGVRGGTLKEAGARVAYLKDIIENKGGHRLFYVEGKPLRREKDLQIMFRLTWYGTRSDISREVDDGRGPVDFKVSHGALDKSLVEFKLASNSHLKKNLDRQTRVYEKASDAKESLKVIVYFTEQEIERVERILQDLGMQDDPNIVLIDARDDNKPSGSMA
jgi:hypothetical protein